MQIDAQCPECGAVWTQEGDTCTDHFHVLLAWELEHQLYDAHHLLVLCFHLQHPSLYSPQTLLSAKQMLVDFCERGVSPQQMREQIANTVDSGVRQHKIKGTPESFGKYDHPITWTMHVSDITRAGIERYYESVYRWADSVLESLRASGNLSR